MDSRNRFAGIVAAGLYVAASSPVVAQDALRISFIQAVTAGEWNTEIQSGAEAAIADLDFPVELKIVGPTSFDPGRQATIFQQEAQTGPDAIIVTNVAPALLIEPALQARDAGITVSWINSAPAREFAESLFVSADPAEIGVASAKLVAEDLSRQTRRPAADIEGRMVVGHCVPGLATLENRIIGFIAGVKKFMPKVAILPTIETKIDRESSFVVWSQAIRRTPDALAYVDACEAGNRNIVKILKDDGINATTVSMDTPEDVRLAVAEGTMPGIVGSLFYVQAYVATYLVATALHDGRQPPGGWVKIAPHPVGPDEIGDYIDAWNDPVDGLRDFHWDDITRAIGRAEAGELAAVGSYDTPQPN